MREMWINHHDLPPEGRLFSVTDPAIWLEGLEECKMPCRLNGPVRAESKILPQEQGFLVMGDLTAAVALPCCRCADELEETLSARYAEFEGLDEVELRPEDELVRESPSGLQFNLAGFLWEQFVLALPDHPLCRADCRGLCALCGRNLNDGPCGCASEQADHRFDALRNLKIS